MKLKPNRVALAAVLLALNLLPAVAPAQSPANRVIIDTDIGDDVDDVFAVGLALASPELNIIGISSAWGDTALRSRMVDRLLCETGRDSIPSLQGVAKTKAGAGDFSQKPWAVAGIEHPHKDAVTFLLDQIKQHPGEITLLAIGPLSNIGAAIDRDPQTFRKLKRVVIMGGSIYRGYDNEGGHASPAPPSAEYNIAMDPTSAQKLFRSGVPIYMMPLDSTQLKLDDSKRAMLAGVSTPLTDSLQVLIAEWSRATHRTTPTLFDPVAAAYIIDPNSCPTTPLHIEVDNAGYTRAQNSPPNAQVCLKPQEDAFFKLLLPRLLNQQLIGNRVCVAAAKHPRTP
jgi:inosine-uridine nucleoside N-ribohydrolase